MPKELRLHELQIHVVRKDGSRTKFGSKLTDFIKENSDSFGFVIPEINQTAKGSGYIQKQETPAIQQGYGQDQIRDSLIESLLLAQGVFDEFKNSKSYKKLKNDEYTVNEMQRINAFFDERIDNLKTLKGYELEVYIIELKGQFCCSLNFDPNNVDGK